jgi:hypothetical protein
MQKVAEIYVDLRGRQIAIAALDADERKLLARLQRRASSNPSWTDFGNFWVREVAAFYDGRGVSRTRSRQSPIYRIAQDLCSRLGIAAGLVRRPNYRAELEELIRLNYRTRRAFCDATGLSEPMLSHVLAGRKDLSLGSLSKALDRIGYRLQITPTVKAKRTG